MPMVTFISRSPEQTRALGEEWGHAAQAGWVIGLTGELGAGKTQLVAGLARGLGVKEPVLSPSFTLVHEYQTGRLPLFHIDLYRLETPCQILGAGLEEYFINPPGVTVIEWAERWFGDVHASPNPFLPTHYRSVLIQGLNETERQITYEDLGA